MAIAVETLDKLERRITLTLPLNDIKAEVEKRLKARARTAKAPGFRPGKVPMKMIAAQYGYQVETEVLNDKVGQAFVDATAEADLRIAGMPRIEPKKDAEVKATEGEMLFDAVFEVYPEVKIGDLTSVDVEKTVVNVTEAEIDKTIEILRKQRVHYHVKGEQGEHGDGGTDLSAQNGDRVTVDFAGTIDGIEFQGGKADDYAFVLGEGRMLPEFEAAALGLKIGESKTFSLAFPADYHGKEVAGKIAEFSIAMKKIEWPHLPEINEEFAQSLGIFDGDLQKMREDIRANLEREVKGRTKTKTKNSVMEALVKISELDVPKVLIEQDIQRLIEMAQQDMVRYGVDAKKMSLPPELFNEQAERRVRLGLILAEIVKTNNLQATAEQVKAHVEDFAQSYEDPQQVLRYYYSDRRRLAEVEAIVVEENVVNFVLDKAKVTEKLLSFDELMGNSNTGNNSNNV